MRLQIIKYRLSLILFILSFNIANSQDNTVHNISFAGGHTSYMTSFALPSGLPGYCLSLLYDYNRPSQNNKNRLFYFSSQVGFARLQNKKVNTDLNAPYLRWSLDVNANWLWKLPLKQNKLTIYTGTGVSFDAYYTYAIATKATNNIFTTPYGNWGLAAEFISKIEYRLKKIKIENYFHLPIIKGGHFPLYGPFMRFTKNNKWRYDAMPSTVTWIGNYRDINNQLRVLIPYKKHWLSLSYIFQYQNSNVNKNKERYLQHAFGIGLSF